MNQKLPRPVGLEDVTDRELAWPRPGHDLRTLSGQHHLHAALDAKWGSAYGRAEGYRRAAEVLAEHLAETAADVDSLIYPFANCWRHHIELQLKLLLPELRRLQGEDPPEDNDFGHRLSRLWDRARVLLLAASPSDSTAEVKIVSRVISQLHQLDPGGEDFRYFMRSNGQLALEGHEFLDIANFHEALAGVSSFLDAAVAETCYRLAIKRDIESEFVPDSP